MDAGEIRKRFPQFQIRDDEIGYYESEAGFLRPENCVRAQLALAQKHGANIRNYEKAVTVITKYFPLERFPQKTLYALQELLPQAAERVPAREKES